jgi:type VI secretion system protein VasD
LMHNKFLMEPMIVFRSASSFSRQILPSVQPLTLTRRRAAGVYAALLLCCAGVTGCSTAAVATGKVAEFALSAVGIKMPGSADAPQPPKTVELHIAGTQDLNAGEDGRGLSTVVRLYKLRDQTGFLSMPYTEFGATDKEKASLGTDLVDVKELVLAPGQILDLQEKMPNDTRYFGIVALLRSPAPQRWRFAFALSKVDSMPIVVAVNACTMTAATSIPSEMASGKTAPVPSVSCK